MPKSEEIAEDNLVEFIAKTMWDGPPSDKGRINPPWDKIVDNVVWTFQVKEQREKAAHLIETISKRP